MNRRYGLLAAIASLAATAAVPTWVSARPFGAPVPLSTRVYLEQEVSAATAVDRAGNATAIWNDGAWLFSDHPRDGAWSAPSAFPAGAGTNIAYLGVSADGTQTAITVTPYDTKHPETFYSQDRSPGGVWGAPTIIASDGVFPQSGRAAQQFVENSAGDEAIAYYRSPGIAVIRRQAGGAWSAPETVTTFEPYGSIGAASIGEGGDVVVTWNSFSDNCHGHVCKPFNISLHASREVAAGSGWADSGPLATSEKFNFVSLPAVDPAGGAIVTYESGNDSPLRSWSQRRAGEVWKKPVRAFAPGISLDSSSASEFGRVGIVLQMTAPPFSIVAVDGTVGRDTWDKGYDLTATDPATPMTNFIVGANRKGGMVVEWMDLDESIRAAVRPTGIAGWSPSQTVQSGLDCSCAAVLSAAVGGKERAVLFFLRRDGVGDTETLYAATN